jgi:hypothetical protein
VARCSIVAKRVSWILFSICLLSIKNQHLKSVFDCSQLFPQRTMTRFGKYQNMVTSISPSPIFRSQAKGTFPLPIVSFSSICESPTKRRYFVISVKLSIMIFNAWKPRVLCRGDNALAPLTDSNFRNDSSLLTYQGV